MLNTQTLISHPPRKQKVKTKKDITSFQTPNSTIPAVHIEYLLSLQNLHACSVTVSIVWLVEIFSSCKLYSNCIGKPVTVNLNRTVLIVPPVSQGECIRSWPNVRKYVPIGFMGSGSVGRSSGPVYRGSPWDSLSTLPLEMIEQGLRGFVPSFILISQSESFAM